MMESVAGLVGAGGIFGSLALVLITLIRQNAADRTSFRKGLAEQQRIAEEEQVRHAAVVRDLQQALDAEREKRRRTEDDRDREINLLREKIRQLEEQVHMLSMRMGGST